MAATPYIVQEISVASAARAYPVATAHAHCRHRANEGCGLDIMDGQTSYLPFWEILDLIALQSHAG